MYKMDLYIVLAYYILHINENIKSSQRIQQINVCAKTFHREDIITI